MTKRPLVLLALLVMVADYLLIIFGFIHPRVSYEEGDYAYITGTVYNKQQKDGYNVFYLKNVKEKNKNIGRVILYEYFDQGSDRDIEYGSNRSTELFSTGNSDTDSTGNLDVDSSESLDTDSTGNSDVDSNESLDTDSDENTNKGSYDLSISTKIAVKIKILAMRNAENEGGFDEETFLYSRGIFVKAAAEDIEVVKEPFFSLKEVLFNLREKIVLVYSDKLYGEEAGILATMTVGDKSLLSTDASNMFSEAGLSHIFAISAMHISIVGLGLLGLLCNVLSRKKSIFISSVFVVLYAIMVGGSVSAVRAVGMFLIMMAAFVLEEAYDSLSAMALMVLIILFKNPYALFDVSFIFSFGVVTCLIVVANPVADFYTEYCRLCWEKTHRKDHGRRFRIRFDQRITREVLRGATLQMVSIPIVAYYYFSIPTYVIFLNIILLPILGGVLGCGLSGGLLGAVSVSSASDGLPGAVSGLLLLPCHYIIYFYELMADASIKLPMSRIVIGRPRLWQILIYYILICFIKISIDKGMDGFREIRDREMD